MTEKQLEIMFSKLWKVGTKNKYDALKSVIIDGGTPAESEKIFGLPRNTLARDVTRVVDAVMFCEKVAKAGN